MKELYIHTGAIGPMLKEGFLLMNTKTVAIGLYIMLVYWLSLHVPSLHLLFFPTLGAFSLLFISRPLHPKEVGRVALGAIISSLIGAISFYIHPGVVSLFINTLITIWLIKRFHWNAPPILAVSFIPFFAQSPVWWVVPVSVAGSILGLLATLYIVHVVERLLTPVMLPFVSAKKQSMD
ncbi:HPP family protein [Paenibacillus puerhi]|uniref:HPP family protein n=1 Tax=Paenibacillus puerhi TaxID=2692622 RepID=UPI00135B7B89|nr:HPP family protein [Paenibacillus puerhi]